MNCLVNMRFKHRDGNPAWSRDVLLESQFDMLMLYGPLVDWILPKRVSSSIVKRAFHNLFITFFHFLNYAVLWLYQISFFLLVPMTVLAIMLNYEESLESEFLPYYGPNTRHMYTYTYDVESNKEN